MIMSRHQATSLCDVGHGSGLLNTLFTTRLWHVVYVIIIMARHAWRHARRHVENTRLLIDVRDEENSRQYDGDINNIGAASRST